MDGFAEMFNRLLSHDSWFNEFTTASFVHICSSLSIPPRLIWPHWVSAKGCDGSLTYCYLTHLHVFDLLCFPLWLIVKKGKLKKNTETVWNNIDQVCSLWHVMWNVKTLHFKHQHSFFIWFSAMAVILAIDHKVDVLLTIYLSTSADHIQV